MNILVAGNCDKYDFVLTLAIMLGAYKEESVMIVTDNDRHYRYFQGEASGVKIVNHIPPFPFAITIYDWHNRYPVDVEFAKCLLATNFERSSLAHIDELLKTITPDALLVMEAECGVNLNYIEKNVPSEAPVYSYYDDPRRRIDWVHDGRVELKDLDKEFSETVGNVLTDICELPIKDIKKLWSYARKRGVLTC
ncbi:hypothetical protein GCM10008018_58520 [Paenibacillus marchantiophytorum]|uniref:DUF115 domain-containing protein n=1 Tax=Paenibacillus marchantiophytorum TaxID=1619310 RepID=A0ABQ1FBZ7_9BACL|nr:hypothetical protein [Paenibacillus marchantiophytorum]GGA04929.1 hypothetical protein GCM10008018_58520 [Paenibacillus marchantiophytorum]